MLAHDRRTRSATGRTTSTRTAALRAWVKTMLPAITQSVHDASTQIKTGHQDIRSYFSQATLATTDDTAVPPPVTSNTVSQRPIDIRQRFQSARTRMATFLRYPPVFPWNRRRRHVNQSDMNKPYTNWNQNWSHLPPVRVEHSYME
jgi:hypothetical protein